MATLVLGSETGVCKRVLQSLFLNLWVFQGQTAGRPFVLESVLITGFEGAQKCTPSASQTSNDTGSISPVQGAVIDFGGSARTAHPSPHSSHDGGAWSEGFW
jgi:hypothetical protein